MTQIDGPSPSHFGKEIFTITPPAMNVKIDFAFAMLIVGVLMITMTAIAVIVMMVQSFYATAQFGIKFPQRFHPEKGDGLLDRDEDSPFSANLSAFDVV